MSEQNTPIRVAVVDDHLVVREGLRMMLEVAGKGSFALVGDAADGATALRLVEETQPDVVLMDLRMPGMDGLEAIEQMRTRWPHIAVVILTGYGSPAMIHAASSDESTTLLFKPQPITHLSQLIVDASTPSPSIKGHAQ